MPMLLSRTCLAVATGVCALPSILLAQPVTVNPDNIRVVGTIGKGPLTGTIRFLASEEMSGVKLLVSDLLDDGSGPIPRDPIAAAAVTVVPSIQDGRLTAGLHQFAIQVPSPSEVGRWRGTLLLVWEKPKSGDLKVPILVTARNHPGIGLVAPQQLSFAGASGAKIRFRFQLKETAKGSPTTGVKVLATDLRGTTGTHLLPAERVQPALPANALAGGELMPVSVVVDLFGAESGKYAGQLIVTDAYHNDLSILLEVSVKDNWPVPLAVLVLGVVAGMTISGYRSRGSQRDELILRIEAINARIAETGSLQNDLRPLVQRILTEVDTQIAAKNWQAAREAAARAETLVGRWRSEENAWLQALEQARNLRGRLTRLPDAKLVRDLTRQFDTIDVAGLSSARALADAVHKAGDVLRFFEQLLSELEIIKSEIEELRSPETRRNHGNEFDSMRTRLHDLAADEAQAARDVATGIRTLRQTVRTAREKEDAIEREVDAFSRASQAMIQELQKAAASKAGQAVGRVAAQMLDAISNEDGLDVRRERSENLWRGLWSARTILRLVGSEPTGDAAHALHGWLRDADNYRQKRDEFRNNLRALEEPVLAGWPKGTARPNEPAPPSVPQVRGKGFVADAAATIVPDLPTPDTTANEKTASGWSGRLGMWLGHGDASARTRRSRARLTLFGYGTWLLAIVLLVWIGFTELYAAAPTFGADGTKDYLVLFLWGFGAEATRSAVTEVVKGLVPTI